MTLKSTLDALTERGVITVDAAGVVRLTPSSWNMMVKKPADPEPKVKAPVQPTRHPSSVMGWD